LGVLITMYERGTRLHQLIAQDIRDLFGDKAFQTVIYKNVRLSESEQAGMPIILFDRRASGSQNYEALADEVLGRVPESAQQTALSV
jgi:chromosome partitioning protein